MMPAGAGGVTGERRPGRIEWMGAMLDTGGRGGGRGVVLTAAGYLALAVGLTWPLALNLTTRYAGNRPLDIWLHVWNLWWVRHALTVLRTNPFETRAIFYPDGVPLYLHTLTPLAGLLALPAGLLWGNTAAYNLTAIGGVALAGWATHWLARRWMGPAGAVLAGAAFAAAPWLLHQLRVGHLNLMNAGWLALALLLLLRATDSGRWRDRLLAVLGLVAAALVDWQYVLFLAVAGAVVAAERLITAPTPAERRRRAISLAAVGGLFGALLLPVAAAALGQAATVDSADLAKFHREQVEYSADLAAYLMPQVLHPLWGRAVNAWLVEHPLGAPTEGRVGLAVTALALSGVALAARRPGAALWGAIGLAGLLLSLGPRLHAGGVDLGLPGPYALLGELPLVGFGRAPARFAVLPALAAAVLAGSGLEVLAGAARRRRGPLAGRATALALTALLLFETLPAPYPTEAMPSLALAERIAAAAGAGAVLELPYFADDAPRMLYQTVHQRPIFSGYISRQPPKPLLERAPVLADLMRPAGQPDIVPVDAPLAVLATFGVTLIVVYRPPYYRPDVATRAPSEAQLRQRVEALLRVAGPDWEDETGALYRVPPAAPAPVLTLGDGWHAPEPWPGGWMRWTAAAAALRLDRAGPAPVTLRFTAWSFARPRAVEVLLDGRPLARLVVTPAPQPFALTIPAGATPARLTLRALDGAESPAALGLGADPRPLAVAVADLRAAVAGDGG
jgi:hypothetical protein